MKQILKKILLSLIVLLTASSTAFAMATYFNGFEVDTDGWFTDGSTIERVTSGTNGIPSADGAFHALAAAGAFTRWGGYENNFPADGYVTKLDIYLDMALADGTDKRFDYSSAINGPTGLHRRDFIFSAGTVPGSTDQWAISASNNSPGWPLDPAKSPITISTTGWYTFEHTFQDDGTGNLEVIMKVTDSNDNQLGSWTLSDPTDIIGNTVGGNRYGWIVTNAFGKLAIDNSEKYNLVPVIGPPTTKAECLKDGWRTFNNPAFKNQGECVSYLMPAPPSPKPETKARIERATGDIYLQAGTDSTHIIFNAHETDPVKGKLIWNRTGSYANYFEGDVIETIVNGTDAEFTIEITRSTNFPEWKGWHLKFIVHDGGTPGTAGDTIMWQWITGDYAGGSAYGEPIVLGNLVVNYND